MEEGVAVLHGNRRAFHNDKQPAFKAVYNAIADYDFEAGQPEKDLLERIEVSCDFQMVDYRGLRRGASG